MIVKKLPVFRITADNGYESKFTAVFYIEKSGCKLYIPDVNGHISKPPFLGREEERAALKKMALSESPQLSAIYGRRRVGKTRLVEQAFKGERMISFEGLEGETTAEQQKAFLAQLARHSGRREYTRIQPSDWTDLLIFLSDFLKQTKAIVFFDEFQWMAAERTKLVSSFKYVWDNYFQKKNRAHFILCGSISSFLVRKVIRSKALYGRVALEMNLKPLFIDEIKGLFLPQRSLKEVVELYLCLGGIPQHLQLVDPSRSARANIEHLCFSKEGYLVHDFERIFTSHFGKNRHYKNILISLARMRFATKEQLEKTCRTASGGRMTGYLEELELAGFIESYRPLHQPEAQRLNRWRMADPYLLFYFRFIYPSLSKIKAQRGRPDLSKFVSPITYAIWQGLAFEHFCYQHQQMIAEKLGFSAVNYECGPWFSRADLKSGAQIDMLYKRADRVFTLCEIKFQDRPVGPDITAEVEKKVQALPNPHRWTIEKVLVTASPPTKELLNERYFNRVLELGDLLDSPS